jgi:hypothetical protein
MHKPFLVEMNLEWLTIQNKTKKTMFWGLLGSRHVQTRLENMFLFCFFLVSLFFWFLWVFDSLGFTQINPNFISSKHFFAGNVAQAYNLIDYYIIDYIQIISFWVMKASEKNCIV